MLPDKCPLILRGRGAAGGSLGFGVIGSGIAFADAAHMGTDPAGFLRYVFQNGAFVGGNPITFKDMTVGVTDMVNVAALGDLYSTVTLMDGSINAEGGYFQGYFGLHLMWSNAGYFRGTQFTGNGLTVNGNFTSGSGGAAIAMTAPAITCSSCSAGNQYPIVTRLHFDQTQAAMTGQTNGQLLYQSVAGSGDIASIEWSDATFLFSYDGFVLNALQQTFIQPEAEQIAHTVANEGATSSRNSIWINPSGTFETSLLAGLGPCSQVLYRATILSPASGGSMCGNLFTATAPTIGSGFGTSPSILNANGTASFRVQIGTGGTASSGVLDFPLTADAWNCSAADVTTQNSTVFLTKQTAASSTTATLTNFNTSGAAAAWAAGDILNVSCSAN